MKYHDRKMHQRMICLNGMILLRLKNGGSGRVQQSSIRYGLSMRTKRAKKRRFPHSFRHPLQENILLMKISIMLSKTRENAMSY